MDFSEDLNSSCLYWRKSMYCHTYEELLQFVESLRRVCNIAVAEDIKKQSQQSDPYASRAVKLACHEREILP